MFWKTFLTNLPSFGEIEPGVLVPVSDMPLADMSTSKHTTAATREFYLRLCNTWYLRPFLFRIYWFYPKMSMKFVTLIKCFLPEVGWRIISKKIIGKILNLPFFVTKRV